MVMRLAVALLVLTLGCGHVQPRVGGLRPPVEVTAKIAGSWEWANRSNSDESDVRLEQEEWRLEQNGGEVSGHYDRLVTVMSSDERLFRCNEKTGFTRFARVRLKGTVDGTRVRMREVDYEVKPGPCDDGLRTLVEYTGELVDGVLRLTWPGGGGGQALRPSEGKGRPLAEVASFRAATAAVGASVAAEGKWQWNLRSVDADGDQRIESETWQLEEKGGDVVGHYDRRVVRQRGEGVFSCSGQARMETETRYQIHGQKSGERLTLVETTYKTTPSPCDNGQRRLDTYRGTLSRDGEEITLSWGSGNQVLRRVRPDDRLRPTPVREERR